MVDVPGNSSTTSSITVGGSTTGSLEVVGDHDWFRITLTAGQQIVINLAGTGGSPPDTYLYLRDSAGNLITENDDSGSGTDSKIVFTVPSSGTYYIDVGAYDPYDGNTGTGTYQLSVNTFTPPPVYTDSQVSNQLTSGYWNGDWHHFNVTAGQSLTVNLTGLNRDGKTLARAALKAWTDIIGVNFVEVSSGGQIVFDDSDDGAYTSAVWSNHVTTSASVNISTDWIATYGTGLDTYSFQTYLHEIGHALGLGHAGNYNGDAAYPDDALFANDSWSESVMSYFDQTENSYTANLGFTRNFVATPMIADILAMQTLYGLSTHTRGGNTIYGNGSTAGNPAYDAGLYPDAAVTIYDTGGNDTIDYSGFSTNQTINLNPGNFSNVANGVGNLSIAYGVVIENATGGSGNDTLIGNSAVNKLIGNAGNDILDGGAGADIMRGGSGNDTYYVDNASDKVVEKAGQGTDTIYSSISFSLSSNVENIHLTGSAIRAIGNNLDNNLFGTSGNNVLKGGSGADTMSGGGGNDTYYVDNVGDVIIENNGGGSRDQVNSTVSYTLAANVEDLLLRGAASINATGNGLANSMHGNSGANTINGGAGNDKLSGGGGADILIGGAGRDKVSGNSGADTFVFRDGDFAGLTSSTADEIRDFNHSQGDRIDLAAVDANTTIGGDQAFSFIGTNAFSHTAGELRYQINNGNTYIFGDINGDGVSDFMIRVDGSHALVNGDFVF